MAILPSSAWFGRVTLVAKLGIGKAIALSFAREGAKVVIVGRGESALKETAILLYR